MHNIKLIGFEVEILKNVVRSDELRKGKIQNLQ